MGIPSLSSVQDISRNILKIGLPITSCIILTLHLIIVMVRTIGILIILMMSLS